MRVGRFLLNAAMTPGASWEADTRGATSFSGRFDTGLAGANGFSGRFTGPQAQELVGSFAFPYSADGKTFQAVGASVGKQ